MPVAGWAMKRIAKRACPLREKVSTLLYIYFVHALSLLLCGLFSAWASHCSGFSCFRAQSLGAGASVAGAYRLSCSSVCGIFRDQGSNSCLPLWQVLSPPQVVKFVEHFLCARHPSECVTVCCIGQQLYTWGNRGTNLAVVPQDGRAGAGPV